jgi:hypothetical protein
MTATGCYNNPKVSLRHPGEGPANYMSRPAVGPGTTAGGATAGPQPAPVESDGHTQPQPWGGVPAEPGLGHTTPPRPVQGDPETHPVPPARTGNEKRALESDTKH